LIGRSAVAVRWTPDPCSPPLVVVFLQAVRRKREEVFVEEE
jgi:hypothetical protein